MRFLSLLSLLLLLSVVSMIISSADAELVIISDIDLNGNFMSESDRPSYYVKPSDIAVNDRYLYVLDSNNGNLQIFEKPGIVEKISDENDDINNSRFENNGKEDPILYMENNSDSYILEKPAKFKRVGAIDEYNIGYFNFPTAITIIDNLVYVLDGSKILVFDELGNITNLQIDITEYNISDSQDIVDIHGQNGLLYLIGDWTTPIHVLDKQGTFIESIHLEDQFTKFSDSISINDQFIYVEINTHLQIYDHSGKLIDTIDTGDFGPGIIMPSWIFDIASSNTNIYTIHQTDGDLRIYDANGNFETSFDFSPRSSGLSFVGEMIIDDKYIYVTNSGPHRNAIHVLDFSGNLIQQISNYGLPPISLDGDPPADEKIITSSPATILPKNPAPEPNMPLSVPVLEEFEIPSVMKIPPESSMTPSERLMEPIDQITPESPLLIILPIVIPPSILSIILIKRHARNSKLKTIDRH